MPSDPEMFGLQSFGDMDQVKGNIHKPYPWNEMPSAAPVLLTFGSLNIVYPRCIMFTQPFWKTIFRLPKPPSHQIRPASRQIIPIPLHQNALKETYSLLWNVSLFFLIVCGFPIQTWQKLLEYGNQPASCLFARYPIQPKFCLRLKF